MRVAQNDANLRGSSTLLGELANLLDNLVGGGLEPRGGGARVGESGGRNALALAVKSTHIVGVVVVILLTRWKSCGGLLDREVHKFQVPRACVER